MNHGSKQHNSANAVNKLYMPNFKSTTFFHHINIPFVDSPTTAQIVIDSTPTWLPAALTGAFSAVLLIIVVVIAIIVTVSLHYR